MRINSSGGEPIQHIIITGDLLRYGNGSPFFADPIVDKSCLFFGRAIECATGISPEPVYAKQRVRFDRDTFYRLSHYTQASEENWIKLACRQYSEASLQYFAQCFRGCLFIIQEAGPIKLLLDQLSIPYIEHCISSIRFLEDLHYAFRTNLLSVRQRLLRYRVDDEEIFANAERVRLYYAQYPSLAGIKPGSLLLCGQKAMDLSLMKDGASVSFLRYKEEISKLIRSYSHVYFKRHPYSLFNNPDDAFVRSHKNVSLTNANFYRLMSDDRIAAVAALSSGTLNEAPYFLKTAHTVSHCFAQHYTGPEAPLSSEWITLRSDYFSPSFWANILEDVLPVRHDAQNFQFAQKDVVRNTLRRNWGYEIGAQEAATILDLDKQFQKLSRHAAQMDLQVRHLCLGESAARSEERARLSQKLGISGELMRMQPHLRALFYPFLPIAMPLLKKLFPRDSKRRSFFSSRIPREFLKERLNQK